MNTNKQSASNCQRCGAALTADAAEGLCPRCLLALNLGPQTQLTGDEPTARHPAPPPSIAELAPLFPQLEILELLGRGGMGAVYRARQKQLDRIVALKILPPGVGSDAAFAARFATEARALAKLNHPNIVTLYEFGSTQLPPTPASPDTRPSSLFFFLMEFVDGMNLRQLLSASRLSPREALAIVPQICDALQYAHDAGIVHRDIKPENILLDRRGRVKVADFGLAKLVGQADSKLSDVAAVSTGNRQSTIGNVVMGTPQYMAPEQREHPTDVDHRADIYSLGVVFYQMLTGELPQGDFAAPSKRVLVDVRLDEVVLRAMEKKPELRYQHVSDVKTMVETIAGTPAPRPATAEKPEAHPSASETATPYYHRAESFSERWAWDATLVWCVTMLLAPLPGILAACLVPTLGPKALFFLLLELVPLLNAVVYFSVLRRVDRLRDSVTADALELAEGLLATHTKQSPCLAALSAGRLDLLPVTGAQISIPLNDIEAVTEFRWISGRRLWWKRGLKIQRRSAPPVVLALAEPVFHRWQPLLAGTVQKLAAQPSRAAVTPSPVESPTRIFTRNLILIFSMAFGVVALPIALAASYPWKQFGLICAPILIVVGFLRLIGKWPFPALFPASAPTPGTQTPPADWTGYYEYKSKRTLCGLPLLHVANGVDPQTGKARHARGIVAIGGVATGWLAFGGRAHGGIAMGGIALGGVAFGGVAVGLFALGGVALALLMAVGGLALAPVAVDGRPGNMVLWDGHYAHGESFHGLTGSQLNVTIIAFWIVFVALMLISIKLTSWARKQSFRAARTADEPQPEAASAPRCSRTAIVGACWAPLCFIAFVLMLCNATAKSGDYHGPAWWQLLMMIVLGGLGITAPFGTTILGWIAVAQIRRSAGKLFGLGLAVFDGLLFPLLLLDGICVGVLVGLSRIFVELYANFSNVNNPQVSPPFVTRLANLLSQHPEITWLVAVLLVLIVDFLIILAVWRAVNKSPNPDGAAVPTVPHEQKLQRKLRVFSVGLLVVGAANALMFLSGGLGLLGAFAYKGLPMQASLGFLPLALFFIMSILVILGAVQILRLRSYALAVTGSILAIMTFSPLLPLGIGFGLGCLLMLFKPGVRQFFQPSGTAPSGSATQQVPSLGKTEAATFQCLENVAQPPSRFSRTAITSALCLLALAFVGVATWVVLPLNQKPQQAAPSTATFGPMLEQTIALGNTSNSFYSTARAGFVPGPQALQVLADDTALWKWLTEHDVDFLVRRDQGRPVLTLSDMVATSCQETDFERWTPDALMRNAALQELMLKPLRPNFQMPLSGNFGGKITLAFQTRYERFGMVQVIGVGNNPPSLTLRYKLVQEAGATQAATTKPTVRAPQAVTATGSLESATNGAATTWACKALVAEFDIASVDVGQEVRLTLVAFPKRVFHGKVTRVGNTPPFVAQNYVLYETMIEIADPDPKFKAGMSANVLFSVAQYENQTKPVAPVASHPLRDAEMKVAQRPLVTYLASQDQVAHIEELLKHTAGTADYPAALFVQSPSQDAYRLRNDVSVFPIRAMEKAAPGNLPLGEIYQTGTEAFFLKWNRADSVAGYYGPFTNTPEKVLGLIMLDIRANASAPAATATPAFGPVMEHVVPFSAPCVGHAFQFRSGQLFVDGHGPGTTKEQADEDLNIIEAAGGVDARANGDENGLQFAGEGCLFLKAVVPRWQEATAANVVDNLKDTTWIVGILQPTRKDLPLTAYFKTARGEMGILQLLDIVEDARGFVGSGSKGYGVKLRYKLVQTGATNAVATHGGR